MQEQAVQGFRLSPQQRHLWSLHRSDDGAAYRVRCAVEIEGPLDPSVLRAALGEVVGRQEILRTTFQRFAGMTVPVQVIADEGVAECVCEDLSALPPAEREAFVGERFAEAESLPFDLERGPLVRTSLYTLAPTKHVLHLSLPALCADAVGVRNLVGEIARSYATLRGEEATAEEAVQYADLSEWQNELLESEDTQAGRDFWRKRSQAEADALKLPFERVRRTDAGFAPRRVSLPLDPALDTRVRELCERTGATPANFYAACWQALLWRLTRRTDFVLGVALDGRKYEELKEAVGLFARLLPSQCGVNPEASFTELVGRADEEARELHTWQEFYSRQPSADGDGAAQFFSVCFQFDPPRAAYKVAGLTFEVTRQEALVDRFNLMLAHTHRDGAPHTDFYYDPELFDAEDVGRLGAQYQTLVADAAAHPERAVRDLEVLPAEERRQVVLDFNRTRAGFPSGSCLHELIEAQAERTPGAVAAVCEGAELTYGELERRANRMANYLRARGVGPEVPVAVFMERSLEMLVALVGILKAGGAYMPLHPAYPKESLSFQLQDSKPRAVLLTSGLAGQLPETEIEVVCLDTQAGEVALESEERPDAGATPGNVALLQYTSGSTGRPKAIMLEHHSLVNYLTWVNAVLCDESVEHIPSVSRLTVDASLKQLFAPLLRGGRAWVIPRDVVLQPAALLRRLGAESRVGLNCVPALWRAVLDTVESGDAGMGGERLASLLVGGEELTPELVRRTLAVLPGLRIWNLYGPAEVTANASAGVVTSGDSVTIGRPVANAQTYVLDEQMRPAPLGVPGELYVGGEGLARGYQRRPSLTAEKFVPDPFSPEPGTRLYRTGDLARWLPSGEMEFLGRADHQVKIRGFRVELGEVEAALRECPGVGTCAAVALRDEGGSLRLVAYVVGESGAEAPGAAELRRFLSERLPEQMLPSAYVTLAELPMLPNGKLDRRALPAPGEAERSAPTDPEQRPRTPAERELCRIWQEVLGLEEVGCLENFFELGGDSILSIQIVARANRAGLRLTPRQLFENQTVRALAAVAGVGQTAEAEQGAVTGDVELTPIQSRFFEVVEVAPHHFNQSLLLEARRRLDTSALREAVAALLTHHDALRLRFTRDEEGRWRQHNAAEETAEVLSVVNLGEVEEGRLKETLEAAAARAQRSLDLEHGPLMRVVLFECGESSPQRLLFAIHHLSVDGISWRVLLEDLQRGYAQAEQGDAVDLGTKGTSWKEWAGRVREWARGAEAGSEADYWLAETGGGRARLPRDFDAGDNSGANAEVVTVQLGEDETRALLTEVPSVYRTQVNDALLSALAETLCGWSGGRVLVELEGHGREELFEGVDVSRTAGWFTARYPVALEATAGDTPGELLKRVKEKLRGVPRKGVGYGALKYLRDDETGMLLRGRVEGEVSFNYLGQFDGVLREGGLLGAGRESSGASRDPRQRRAQLLDVSGSVVGGRLQMNWRYGREVHKRATVEALAGGFMDSLRRLVQHSRAADAEVVYTPSDFPLTGLTETELKSLIGTRRDVDDVYPLSPMQEGMLYHSITVESGAYFGQTNFVLRGDLDVHAFERAWQNSIDRHPMLRTSFDWERLKNPVQVVSAKVSLPLERLDWRGLAPQEQEERVAAFLKADREVGFDLSRPPLMRLTLIRLSEDTYHFVWSHHHIQLDGWSVPLLLKEIFLSYEALRRGEEPQKEAGRSYRDYIAWLRRQDMSEAEAFWCRTLAGFDAPTPFGVDRAPGERPRRKGGVGEARLRLSEATTENLQWLARQHHVTLNTIVQGVWALLLSRYGGTRDVLFGITVSGRPAELADVESIVGPFFNTLPVRVEVTPESPVFDWLAAIQTRNVELHQYEYSVLVQQHSGVPLGRPLFENILVFENYPVDASVREQKSNVEVLSVRATLQSKYALTLIARPTPVLSFRIAYDDARFEAGAVERMLEHLRNLLEDLAADPSRTVAELRELSKSEWRELTAEAASDEAGRPRALTLHAAFAAQVERSPEALAVLAGGQRISYREMDALAEGVARRLRALGVGLESRVGLYTDGGSEEVVGMLAILKAGGACVGLDARRDVDELAFIAADAGPVLVLTAERLAAHAEFLGARVLTVESARDAAEGSERLEDVSTPDALACVAYADAPLSELRGVALTHRAVAEALAWKRGDFAPGEGDRVRVEFAAGVGEYGPAVLWPLLSGATLVVSRGADAAAGDDARVNVVITDRATLDASAGGARLVRVGDFERFEVESGLGLDDGTEGVRAAYARPETGGAICQLVAARDDEGARAFTLGSEARLPLLVLNDDLNPAPVGVVGDVYVAGEALARGYFNAPAATAESFIPNPHAEQPGARLFRTGLVGRRQADGGVRVVGRAARRIDVGGSPVSLDDVTSVLARHPDVREAYVREHDAGYEGIRLVAYVALREGAAARERELRSFVREWLPEQLAPDFYEFVETLPRTRAGRLDPSALPVPRAAEGGSGRAASGEGSPVEELLAGIWAETLGLRRVEADDNFFELGGHSLLATKLVSRVRERFRVELPLRSLFESPTPAGLAARIEEALKSGRGLLAPPVMRVSREGELPLSFAQHRLWFLDQLEPGNAFYNGLTAVRLKGRLDLSAFALTFDEILRRHEVFRTSFPEVDGKPRQVISPPSHEELPVVDLSPLADPEAAASALANEEVRRPFDLARGPLLRVRVLRLGAQDHVVLFAVHHIAFDAWSRAVLVREVAALYEAFSSGRPSPLEELSVQYADYAHWQRSWLSGEVLEEHLAFWRRQLGGTLPESKLPTDRPRPAKPSYRGARQLHAIPEDLAAKLRALSRGEGVTLFMTLLAAYDVLLYRHGRQEDVLVGTSVAGRGNRETEPLMGFFINLLALRADLSGDPTFRELLGRIREVTLAAYAHQELPFDKIIEELQPERHLSRTPIVQAIFGMQNAGGDALELPGLTLSPLEFEHESVRFDLTLYMIEDGVGGLKGSWRYSVDLFDASTIERLAGRFEAVLRAAVENPDARIDSLELLAESERAELARRESEQAESGQRRLKGARPKPISIPKQ